MSEKNYNFENFESDEIRSSGKHYKADENADLFSNSFDVDESNASVTKPIEQEDTTPDYGDDFDGNDDDFIPYVENAYPKYEDKEKKPKAASDKKLKQKNTVIIVLSVVLALVVLGFALFFIISAASGNSGDTKATKPTLSTSQNATKPSEKQTETPTAAPTDAPTEAPTEAPTDPPTDPPTEAPTEAPTEVVTEDDAGGSIEDPTVENISWE